ncbi:glycosyl hydrolase family 95 catalytic domain-containing protein [Flavihumibacter fluvii]|uniref:glycosyl hydrolase family 95 catalytic domain-containing protein n=1 Tax=Flavihumibacter fluvii TaxID=2838157 RepID=UPI001BDE8AC3|nr:glycoside hydrolase N-terminal domain-containing protein [Flavihumibacter fluvii]ULQ51574.1 glycoside hydrolase family 95 protein [Flavihumibacter fluvii]
MQKFILLFLSTLLIPRLSAQPNTADLKLSSLAKQWDEAVPLGNGMLGALVWEKDQQLRISLDRADLWDARPMKGLHREEFSYAWVQKQVNKKDYAIVQQYFDAPYDHQPAPSKIPGGALQINTSAWGIVQSVQLTLQSAVCEIKWENGTILKTFVQSNAPVGWFRLEKISGSFDPRLLAPRYQGEVKTSGDPVGGDDLSRLGYRQGSIVKGTNNISYHQDGWGGFSYEISLRWKKIDAQTIEGVWSISSHYPKEKTSISAQQITKNAMADTYASAMKQHLKWWMDFWGKSNLHIPDTLIEKQWRLEQYKFGSAARKNAPPISLQAIWTADNGRLPPWKGDYHHDLNTQLSYWPAYSGNHLEEAAGYLDHLLKNTPNYKRYTKTFFGVDGIAVPGVTTLDGTEMGGWIQYSLSPTVSAWLSQHFFWHWKYTMDHQFLQKTAYPWVKEVAHFLEKITVLDPSGKRKLPISSSPEINDNSLSAWFTETTNYDLALMKFAFKAATEMADALHMAKEAAHWKIIGDQFNDLSLSSNHELKITPSLGYNQSHRHFSHMMAIHPLGLIQWEDGPAAQQIIHNSIALLDSIGPDFWMGYSYAWLANLKARAKDGEGAAKALTIFAKAFCSANSFHLNGDQTNLGYSSAHYRPFTLEGNFAFAAGLQEMLLQSYGGQIAIFPAIPASWKTLSFDQLRAEGAFLVSAAMENGIVTRIKILSEKGGKVRLKLPSSGELKITASNGIQTTKVRDGELIITATPGGYILFETVQ